MKKLLLLDANSILNRCFFGMGPLNAPDGFPTNAIFGTVKILLTQIDALAPDYIAAAFDVHHPTFRHEMYADYKAGRHETPPDLLSQFPVAKEVFSAMGIRVCEKPGYEADDILGTLSYEAEKEGGITSYLMTGDRDSLQLIGKDTNVLLATNKQTVLYDTETFEREYGVRPDQFVDVKALMGDSSDNIPGVRGIGPKTALSLIAKYKTLEGVFESLNDEKAHTPSLCKKLAEGRESAMLSRTLSRIEREAPIGVSLSDCAYHGADTAVLYPLFNRLGFVKLIEKMGLREEAQAAAAPHEAREAIPADAKKLSEAASVSPLSLSVRDDGTLLLADCDTTYLVKDGEDALKTLLTADGARFICHDAKALQKRLCSLDIEKNVIFDVMLAAYILKPQASAYGLPDLAAEYGCTAADDAELIFELYTVLSKKLADAGQSSLLYDIELPTAFVLARMELAGFKVDTAGLSDYGKELEKLESALAEQIWFRAGEEFNINSPKQLGEILFEKLKLPCPKKSKSGWSTAQDVLEKLRDHPIVSDVLEYRHIAKLRGTYAVGLLSAADENGIVRTTFQQCVTATGRLSSTDPNLQNIPIRTKLGREFRRYFIPKSKGRVLIDADYSQIELRLLAHVSDDAEMVAAFRRGDDIHTATAAAVFGIPEPMVTEELRKRAKAVNFGIVYGIGAYSLSQDLSISMSEAKKYIDSYLSRYSGVAAYLEKTVQDAYRDGYVTTISGRRRDIPELSSSNRNLRSFGERVAMNSPIQGSAADIIKIAMIRVDRALREARIDARLILQVHDELVLDSAPECADLAREILVREMENAASLRVPMPVDVTVGETWYDN